MGKTPHNPLLIACQTIINEVHTLVEERVAFETLEAGLHNYAQRLTDALAASVNKADGNFDPIILGYGLCGNAVLGLSTRKSTLIIPKADDCIAMMLGSTQAYQALLKEHPGTYFLSRGWVDSRITLLDEFKELTERYGESRALWVQKKMFQNYEHLVYVETDTASSAAQETIAKSAAAHMDLSYRKITGTSELLHALVNGPWDHRFIISPPGREITLSDFSQPGKGYRSR